MPADAGGDLIMDGEPDPNAKVQMLSAVVRSLQAAKQANQAGNLPGDLQTLIDSFLEPKIPWRNVLYRWMTDLLDTTAYTWKRPNRRYSSIYLPSADMEDGRLNHLAFIEDVSGSIGEEDSRRFNSEVKYVWETLKPRKLTLIQFDTKIQNVKVFEEGEEFEKVELVGHGGTSLACVRTWLEENKPEAAIIFSDMECDSMQPLTFNIPIIWGVIRHTITHVPFGEIIHVED